MKKFIKPLLEQDLSFKAIIEKTRNEYNNLSKILEIPIFYNSPEIKSAVAELQETRDVLLYIANQLVEDKKTLNEEVDIEKETKGN